MTRTYRPRADRMRILRVLRGAPSDGWTPGLVGARMRPYRFMGTFELTPLHKNGLIERLDDGRYRITPKGRALLQAEDMQAHRSQ